MCRGGCPEVSGFGSTYGHYPKEASAKQVRHAEDVKEFETRLVTVVSNSSDARVSRNVEPSGQPGEPH